MKAKKATEI